MTTLPAIMCTAAWAGAGLTVRRCVRTWRTGADRPWDARWDVLSTTLYVSAFATLYTALLLPDAGRSSAVVLATVLVLGGVAAGIARIIARRRHTSHARALRQQLGLTVERRMLHPYAVMGLWVAASALAVIVWAVVAADGSRPATDRMIGQAATGLMVLLVVGGLHALYQEHRRNREQQRVRAADQRYLNDGEADAS